MYIQSRLKLISFHRNIVVILLTSLLLVACGGSTSSKSNAGVGSGSNVTPPAAPIAPTPDLTMLESLAIKMSPSLLVAFKALHPLKHIKKVVMAPILA
jgi:hypothetical protein